MAVALTLKIRKMKSFNSFFLTITAISVAIASCTKVPDDVPAQEESTTSRLVSYSLTSSVPAEEAIEEALEVIKEESGRFTDSVAFKIDKFIDDIDLEQIGLKLESYRITYWSKDNRGNDILLNGDVAFLQNPFNKGCRYLESVSLFHTALFTSSNRATNYEGSLIPMRAIHNALVVHPLYQGVEIDKGKNDIAISEQLLKARQAIDCERAALEFIRQKEGVEMMPGYYTDNISLSVGSGSALATHYLLEQDKEYSKVNREEIHLSGSCLCEGCYSFRSILSVFITSKYDTDGENHVGPYCLIAAIVGAYDCWKGIDKGDGSCFFDGYEVEDFFSEKFLSTEAQDSQGNLQGKNLIEYYRAGDMNHFKEWKYEGLNPLNMLSPEIYAADGSIDENNPKSIALLEALGQNDIVTSGWSPKADLCFCHSLDDELIPYSHVFGIYRNLSCNGFNRNVKMKTAIGVGHDDGNILFVATRYLLRKHPAR